MLLLAGAVLALASCVSPIAKRIEHNPAIYQALSEPHKNLVRTGQIAEGMSKPAVFIAWGRPDRSTKGSKGGKSFERWSYSGYDAVHGTSLGFGYGYGGWGGPFYYDTGLFYQPTVTYVPYERKYVIFINDRVSEWSRGP